MKTKKINFQMLSFIDCVGYPAEEIPNELIVNLRCTGSIQDIKAVAYKSLKDLGAFQQDTNLKI